MKNPFRRRRELTEALDANTTRTLETAAEIRKLSGDLVPAALAADLATLAADARMGSMAGHPAGKARPQRGPDGKFLKAQQ